jgi:hypothetical protein
MAEMVSLTHSMLETLKSLPKPCNGQSLQSAFGNVQMETNSDFHYNDVSEKVLLDEPNFKEISLIENGGILYVTHVPHEFYENLKPKTIENQSNNVFIPYGISEKLKFM